jgi:hypothetical protein
VELPAALGAGEQLVDRGGETGCVEHRFGAGRERAVVELHVRKEAGELEHAGPDEASHAHQVEQRVLASTDQRSRWRRSSSSFSTATVTATTIKLATRPLKSACRDQNPSLAKSQATAAARTRMLMAPMIRVERRYVRGESERRGPVL